MRAIVVALTLLASLVALALVATDGGHGPAPAGPGAALLNGERVRDRAARRRRVEERKQARADAVSRRESSVKSYALRHGLVALPSFTPLSAYAGYVVYSEDAGSDGRYTLRVWHDGRARTLPVAARPIPFDADAGPDAEGRPAVVFSRCDREPESATDPDWGTAAGCRLYEMPLTGGGPVQLGLPVNGSASTPSLYEGDVAFALLNDSTLHGPAVMLWNHRTGGVRRLHGGHEPVCQYCAARLSAMDLGPAALAFVWDGEQADEYGVGPGPQLRADRLRDNTASVISSGYVSGACGSATPSSPNVTAAGRVVFLDMFYDCDGTHSVFDSCPLGGSAGDCSEIEPNPVRFPAGGAYAMTADGDTAYWILGPSPDTVSATAEDYCLGRGCVLVRSRGLHFQRDEPGPD